MAGLEPLDRRSVQMPEEVPRWLKPANKVIVALQKLGLAIGTMHVLTVPGRYTGQLQETPVPPLTVDGKRFVIAGYDSADWVKNVRESGRAVLRRGRRQEGVRLIELPTEERGRILRAFPEKVPHGTAFFDRLYDVGSDPEKFAELASVCPVFRVEAERESSGEVVDAEGMDDDR